MGQIRSMSHHRLPRMSVGSSGYRAPLSVSGMALATGGITNRRLAPCRSQPKCRALALVLLVVTLAGAPWLPAADPVDLGPIREEHVMIPMRDGKRLSAY